MSIVDHKGEVEYPFSIKTVFNAVLEAVPKMNGLKLDSADELSGRITLKAGVSLASWGENIPIQLVRVSATRTQMSIISTPKTGIMFGGAMDLGKNRENIEKIIRSVSDVLATRPPEVEQNDSNVASVTDELLKLKKLLDEGVLTQGEFEEQKKKILNDKQEPNSQPSNLMQDNRANQAIEKPVRIEGKLESNSTTYAIVAIIAFVILFIILMAI